VALENWAVKNEIGNVGIRACNSILCAVQADINTEVTDEMGNFYGVSNL